MHPIHSKLWTEKDRVALRDARTFSELGWIALEVMGRYDLPLQMVSGPISTGGVGTAEGNRKVFRSVIETLADDGVNVFSQMPFEEKIVELFGEWRAENPDGGYCMPILEEFYEAMFSSGMVETLHFIDGYESSVGARWEHRNCDRWKISRRYLPPEVSARIMTRS